MWSCSAVPVSTPNTCGDTGEADPRLAAALAAGESYGGSAGDHDAFRAEVFAALVDARVFAAITATSTRAPVRDQLPRHRPHGSSTAEMAVVLLEVPDGTRALPVFPDLTALGLWRPDVRPVPLSGAQACAAALDAGATGLVLDPAGAAITVTDLATLARGWIPVAGTSLATRRAAAMLHAPAVPPPVRLVEALRSALAEEDLLSARLLDGPDGGVLGVAGVRHLAPASLAALAHRLVKRLGPDLPSGGLDLVEVAAEGEGQELLRRRPLRR